MCVLIMLTVNVLCIGGLKESYWRDACAEYSKRLSAFCKFNIIQLDEARLPKSPSDGDIKRALCAEGRALLEQCRPGSRVIAMCIEGKQMSSQQLAGELAGAALDGYSCVNIIIGGSYGLSPEVKSRADVRLSMSPMTFPHQLARVMVCEQVYRAFSINGNGKYHK